MQTPPSFATTTRRLPVGGSMSTEEIKARIEAMFATDEDPDRPIALVE
ncbi:MAG: hypothetical protein WAW17_27375 [Rhodococcus sp. (in: high G+C Gram-positive bacteria)]